MKQWKGAKVSRPCKGGWTGVLGRCRRSKDYGENPPLKPGKEFAPAPGDEKAWALAQKLAPKGITGTHRNEWMTGFMGALDRGKPKKSGPKQDGHIARRRNYALAEKREERAAIEIGKAARSMMPKSLYGPGGSVTKASASWFNGFARTESRSNIPEFAKAGQEAREQYDRQKKQQKRDRG
jgi:hypothetical protein